LKLDTDILIREKLEDIVSIVFIPLYFALSGLSTNLGLLNNGTTWAYTIAIMVLAFIGKFGGCTIAAHFMAGFNWREATTIGSLMSCKGWRSHLSFLVTDIKFQVAGWWN
jgi:Kef-type K+ transport system membrane component KefB